MPVKYIQNVQTEPTDMNDTPFTPWGFARIKVFDLYYGEIGINMSGFKIWWGGPVVDYTIVGFGHHSIHWIVNYTVYTYSENMTQPQVGSFQGNDSLYVFNPHLKPMIRLKAEGGGGIVFYMYNHGNFTASIYIDGKLVGEKFVEYTHH